MSFATMMVHVDAERDSEQRIQLALGLADRFQATLIGVAGMALRPAFSGGPVVVYSEPTADALHSIFFDIDLGERINEFAVRPFRINRDAVKFFCFFDALDHFNAFGWHEGRNPNSVFDTAGYLAHYADVAKAGINPLEHYEQFGWREGRDPSAHFDTLVWSAATCALLI